MKILLIEDNPETASLISRGLQDQAHSVTQILDGKEGLATVMSGTFDIVICDRMLPGIDGLSVVKAMRKANIDTPVIMLTAMTGIDDRVDGLNAGADDYVVKPFAFEELYARIQAQARRKQMEQAASMLQVGDLHLNRTTHEVRRGDQIVELLPREYKILEFLMQNEGQVVTRTMLLERVWGYKFDPKTSLVQTHVSRLRNRVDKPFEKELIKTHRGEGYVISDQN